MLPTVVVDWFAFPHCPQYCFRHPHFFLFINSLVFQSFQWLRKSLSQLNLLAQMLHTTGRLQNGFPSGRHQTLLLPNYTSGTRYLHATLIPSYICYDERTSNYQSFPSRARPTLTTVLRTSGSIEHASVPNTTNSLQPSFRSTYSRISSIR